MPFDGETYVPELDKQRITTQLDATLCVLRNGQWWSLEKLAEAVQEIIGKKATEASVSARIRDLRKKKFGGHTIERKRVSGGLYHYRWVRPKIKLIPMKE